MRPVKLTLKGFTSFRDETTLDFEGRDLFVITGPTGAGKSSILDAITWALYGQVPKVGTSVSQLKTHGEPTMWVHFEFSTRAGHYRVSRRRPATTGNRLERLDEDGTWIPIADRAKAVTSEINELLGMGFTTFTRTVLLPQGAFDAFLRGEQRERRDILSNLLGLGVYSEARAIAGRRASNAARDAKTIREQRDALKLATPAEVAELEATRAAAEELATALAARRTALQTLGDLARTMGERDRDAQAAREASEGAAKALEAARADATTAEQRVSEAERAVEAAERTIAELDYDARGHATLREQVAALERTELAQRAVAEAEADVASAEEALTGAREEERSAVASQERAAEAVAAAEGARAVAVEALSSAAAGAQRAATRIREELQQLAERRDGLQQQASERKERARQLSGLHEQHRAASARHRAALMAAEAAVAEAQTADAAASSADEARAAARAQVVEQRADLEDVRRREQAADLRSVLKPGDPCPVCGQPIEELAAVEASVDLAAAEHAVADRERALRSAEEAWERRYEVAARAHANARTAARTVVEAEREMNELVQQIGFAGVTADELEPAMAAAERDASARMAEAKEVAESLEAAQAAERALGMVLARMPEGIALADVVPGGNGDAVGPLEMALEAYAVVTRDLEAARLAVAEASGGVEGRRRLVAAAEQRVEQARAALTAARERLEGLPDVGGDGAEALRAGLAAADAAAGRLVELTSARESARTNVATAQARLEMAQAALARAESDADTRAAGLRTAEAAHAQARRAFVEGWTSRPLADGESAGEPSVAALKALMDAVEGERDANRDLLSVTRERLAEAAKQTQDAARMGEEIAQLEGEAALAGALETDLRGPNFLAYVQQEAMQLLAADATHHLTEFTNGRYELVAEPDQFAVVDRFNGDERRSVKTLSGGETFLASLALSLSLSEHLPRLSDRGGIVSLESLFLDEGFGSLDAESLDLAVQGLETLAGGHRMIGVISHVPELAERIPDRVEVRKGERTSTIVSERAR